jgi:hypothetical protein
MSTYLRYSPRVLGKASIHTIRELSIVNVVVDEKSLCLSLYNSSFTQGAHNMPGRAQHDTCIQPQSCKIIRVLLEITTENRCSLKHNSYRLIFSTYSVHVGNVG